jgi:regulator of protease activity HflC (stomatin/prohibitin superfamily)
LAIYKEQNFADRRGAANDAKKALLAKFKARPSDDDPAVIARKAERQRILEEREKREIEKEKKRQERLAIEAKERAEREAREAVERAEREAREAEEARIREAEEMERLAAEMADEAAKKAKRDARYAARKQRNGRMPPPPRPS